MASAVLIPDKGGFQLFLFFFFTYLFIVFSMQEAAQGQKQNIRKSQQIATHQSVAEEEDGTN